MTALKEWLERTETTQVKLSEDTGIDQALLSKYARGEWTPKIENAKKIEDATHGGVPISSWFRKKDKNKKGGKAA